MTDRDKIGALILIGLIVLLFVVLILTANAPIGRGDFFDN
jgi:hypothetical protein